MNPLPRRGPARRATVAPPGAAAPRAAIGASRAAGEDPAGGTAAIDASAEAELAACTSAELARHFGATRLETAIVIARDFYSSPDTFALATGYKWPDAVVAANVSHAYDAPVLLTADEELFAPLVDYIDERQPPDGQGLVLGGVAVIPDQVEEQFEAALR